MFVNKNINKMDKIKKVQEILSELNVDDPNISIYSDSIVLYYTVNGEDVETEYNSIEEFISSENEIRQGIRVIREIQLM